MATIHAIEKVLDKNLIHKIIYPKEIVIYIGEEHGD